MSDYERETQDEVCDVQEWAPCEQCGGEVGTMGRLGRLEHGLCRQCGAWYSREAD